MATSLHLSTYPTLPYFARQNTDRLLIDLLCVLLFKAYCAASSGIARSTEPATAPMLSDLNTARRVTWSAAIDRALRPKPYAYS